MSNKTRKSTGEDEASVTDFKRLDETPSSARADDASELSGYVVGNPVVDLEVAQALTQIDSAVGDWLSLAAAVRPTSDYLSGFDLSGLSKAHLPISDVLTKGPGSEFNTLRSLDAFSMLAAHPVVEPRVPQGFGLATQSIASVYPFVVDQETAKASTLASLASSLLKNNFLPTTPSLTAGIAGNIPFVSDTVAQHRMSFSHLVTRDYSVPEKITTQGISLLSQTTASKYPFLANRVVSEIALSEQPAIANYPISNGIFATAVSALAPARKDSSSHDYSGVMASWWKEHRSAIGPISDMYFAHNESNESASAIRSFGMLLNTFESKFERPEAKRLSSLYNGIVLNAGISNADVLGLAKNITSPWVDSSNITNSVSAFANLQGIGRLLQTGDFSSTSTNDFLRNHLGDWRDEISWAKNYSGDLSGRSDLYLSKGLDPYLTNFPPKAFAESLALARVVDVRPSELIEMYGDPLPEPTEEEASEFIRTNKAHLLLLRFEFGLRRFIDDKLTAALGSDWVKQRVPPDMLERWNNKKEKADKEGRKSRPLIEYADFTDYSLLMLKRDVWPVFQPYYKREEHVRESFQRLHWPRIEVSHGRPISQDDELYAYVEIKRLGKAFWN